MALLERCPACRARLADASVCTRCGTDFSISRRAERQAQSLAQQAVRQLARGKSRQAVAAAEAASCLASSLLARVVCRMIMQRESNKADPRDADNCFSKLSDE